MELFVESTDSFFSILGELKKENKGFWWDLYVTKFYDLIQTKNNEAFSYYISQSTDYENVSKWMDENSTKMKEFIDWINKQ